MARAGVSNRRIEPANGPRKMNETFQRPVAPVSFSFYSRLPRFFVASRERILITRFRRP